MDEYLVLEITDEDGEKTNLIQLAEIDKDGKVYLILTPEEDETDEDEAADVFVFFKDVEDGEDVIIPLEDDILSQEIYDIFIEEYGDDFDFE